MKQSMYKGIYHINDLFRSRRTEKSILRSSLPWMRAVGFTCLLAISSVLLSFVLVSHRLVDDIWKQLGITQQTGAEKIRNSFLDNYLHQEGMRNLKNIAAGDRVAVTKGLLDYTKQYVSSTVFKAAYEKMRQSSKPGEPVNRVRSKEAIRKERIEETKKNIAQTETTMKSMAANMQKTMQDILAMHKKNLADYQDPNSKVIELMAQSDIDQYKNEMEHYKQYLKEWEVRYPADYRPFIKGRLQQYLDIAKTVDFSATLTEKKGMYYFDNKTYQYKSNAWKMIFRAGKDVSTTTSAFAEQWIKELQ